MLIVFLALMVSIGAAGIPHAGLVMMVVIFRAIGIPIELAGLLWCLIRRRSTWHDRIAERLSREVEIVAAKRFGIGVS